MKFLEQAEALTVEIPNELLCARDGHQPDDHLGVMCTRCFLVIDRPQLDGLLEELKQ